MENQHTKNWYDRYYKIALILPALVLILSIFYLYNFTQRTGDIIYKDVTLTGVTTITVFDGEVDLDKVRADLKINFPDLRVREISDILTGKSSGFSLTTKAEVGEIRPALESYLGYELTGENSSVEFSGASLSSGFYSQLKYALLLSFLLMAAVVFVIFRDFVPSFIVVLAAFADIVMTIAVVDMLGIQLSSAGIIAFLMLIGYSVDTDILLTTRLIRKTEGGTINQRIYDALKTGMTMTLTSIAAVGVSLLLIYNFSDTLRQIFTILLIGLGFDIFNTWISNASLLKWHMEAKKR